MQTIAYSQPSAILIALAPQNLSCLFLSNLWYKVLEMMTLNKSWHLPWICLRPEMYWLDNWKYKVTRLHNLYPNPDRVLCTWKYYFDNMKSFIDAAKSNKLFCAACLLVQFNQCSPTLESQCRKKKGIMGKRLGVEGERIEPGRRSGTTNILSSFPVSAVPCPRDPYKQQRLIPRKGNKSSLIQRRALGQTPFQYNRIGLLIIQKDWTELSFPPI